MILDPFDLVSFLNDALIELRLPRGWRPERSEADRAIAELESCLLDRERLAALFSSLPAISPRSAGPPPSSESEDRPDRPSSQTATPMRQRLSDAELDGVMESGLLWLYSHSALRFFQIVTDPLHLVLIREAILDEMPDHWSNVARAMTRKHPQLLQDNHGQFESEDSRVDELELAALDRNDSSKKWMQIVPGDRVEWNTSVSSEVRPITLEFEILASLPTHTLSVELIDPSPFPASRCRASLHDASLRELGRYEGSAETIAIPIEPSDRTVELYLRCEIDRSSDESFHFEIPIRYSSATGS